MHKAIKNYEANFGPEKTKALKAELHERYLSMKQILDYNEQFQPYVDKKCDL